MHWREEDRVDPPPDLSASISGSDRTIRERFEKVGFPECFAEYGNLLSWSKPWTQTLDASHPPFYRWFVGGELNASSNCVDRHLDEQGDRAAFRFVPVRKANPRRCSRSVRCTPG